MSWRAVWAIARKDMLIVRRSRAMLYPLVIIPALVLIVLPVCMTLIAGNAGAASGVMGQLDFLLARLPEAIKEMLASRETDSERLIVLGNVYFLAPIYLMVPLLVSAVVAADTFAGEKERRTLEALLYTPLPDRALLAGKMLAAWIPAVAVSLIGFVLYSLFVNLAAWAVMGEVFFPTGMWFLLVLWVGPAVAGLGLGAMVLVSARVDTLQEATQLGSIVVLPIVVLIVGQVSGVLYFSLAIVAILGVVIWSLNAILLVLAMRRFRREPMLTGTP